VQVVDGHASAHAHEAEEFGLECVAGSRGFEWLVYLQKDDAGSGGLAQRQKGAVWLAVQFVVLE
jgi:hypothetical protein